MQLTDTTTTTTTENSETVETNVENVPNETNVEDEYYEEGGEEDEVPELEDVETTNETPKEEQKVRIKIPYCQVRHLESSPDDHPTMMIFKAFEENKTDVANFLIKSGVPLDGCKNGKYIFHYKTEYRNSETEDLILNTDYIPCSCGLVKVGVTEKMMQKFDMDEIFMTRIEEGKDYKYVLPQLIIWGFQPTLDIVRRLVQVGDLYYLHSIEKFLKDNILNIKLDKELINKTDYQVIEYLRNLGIVCLLPPTPPTLPNASSNARLRSFDLIPIFNNTINNKLKVKTMNTDIHHVILRKVHNDKVLFGFKGRTAYEFPGMIKVTYNNNDYCGYEIDFGTPLDVEKLTSYKIILKQLKMGEPVLHNIKF